MVTVLDSDVWFEDLLMSVGVPTEPCSKCGKHTPLFSEKHQKPFCSQCFPLDGAKTLPSAPKAPGEKREEKVPKPGRGTAGWEWL